MGCFGLIILFVDAGATPFFVDELLRRLEVVDVQMEVIIDSLQQSRCLLGGVAPVADRLAHDGAILLLHMGQVVFHVRSGARKGDMVFLAIAQ